VIPAGDCKCDCTTNRYLNVFKVVRRSAAGCERSEQFFAEQEKSSHFVRHRRGAADHFENQAGEEKVVAQQTAI
jgi:hypothetical protein